jgi:hypothetical protein
LNLEKDVDENEVNLDFYFLLDAKFRPSSSGGENISTFDQMVECRPIIIKKSCRSFMKKPLLISHVFISLSVISESEICATQARWSVVLKPSAKCFLLLSPHFVCIRISSAWHTTATMFLCTDCKTAPPTVPKELGRK